MLLPDVVEGPDDPYAWLAYEGLWGERHPPPNSGPTGPAAKPRWSAPVDWHEDLRDTSFVVPKGDSLGAGLVGAFCGVVEWGSVKFIQLQASPLAVVAGLAVIIALAVFAVRRTSWGPAALSPVVHRRRAGEIARTSLAIYRGQFTTFAAAGLVYVPLVTVAGLIAAAIRRVPLIGDLVTVADPGDRVSRLVISAAIGGAAGAAAFVLVAAVACLLDRAANGSQLSTGSAFGAVGTRARPLGAGFLLALAIVVLLSPTVVGIPIALWLAVRYRFLAQTVMLEDADGADALSRSSRLVRGRWWHTAAFVVAVSVVLGAAGLAVGLIALVTITSAPLWILAVIVTACNVLLAPLGAIAMTLLYGDAAAEPQPVTRPAG